MIRDQKLENLLKLIPGQRSESPIPREPPTRSRVSGRKSFRDRKSVVDFRSPSLFLKWATKLLFFGGPGVTHECFYEYAVADRKGAVNPLSRGDISRAPQLFETHE